MKRIFLALAIVLAATTAHAQQATNSNIRCISGGVYVPCPLMDGGAGAITSNTGRFTLGGEPCSGTKLNAPFSTSSGTTTQLVAASMGNKVYICSVNIGPIGSTANNVAFVEDDTAACASPTAGLIGGTTTGAGWQILANSGLALGGANASIAITATTNRYVCIITSSSSVTPGNITYVLAP
jgi:hypothetical protein